MTSCMLMATRLREVFLDGHWIANTNYKEQLLSITWEQATQRIDHLNTIAALTFHINYYLAGLLPVLAGGKLSISDKYSFDTRPILSKNDWDKLVEEFLSNAAQFALWVTELEDAKLDEPFADEKYGSYLRNIEGVIEHSYYHLGQIVLIKKLILNRATL